MPEANTIPNTTRPGFLSPGEAGVTAQPTDPIFAIIARCQLAYEKFGVASLACDEVAAEIRGKPVTDADRDWIKAVSDELDEVRDLLLPRFRPREMVLPPLLSGSWNMKGEAFRRRRSGFADLGGGSSMTPKQIEKRLKKLKADPKYKGMKDLDWRIMVSYWQADQETQDIALGILRGTIDVATTVSLLR